MTEQTTIEKVPLSRAQEELDKIVELFLETKEIPELLAKAIIESPLKPSTQWSFGNQLLMLIHGTADARGFRQWQHVNRYVKKGTRAFYILGPILRTREVEDTITHEKKTIPFIAGFKAIPVFAIEDTDGQDLPIYTPVDPPPLLDVAQKWELKVQYENLGKIAYGSTDPGKEITLSTEDWDVFFHELAHNAQKKIDGTLKGGKDPEQETIAQLSAAVLTRVYGRNADLFTYNYIAHYAERRTPDQVGRMCLRVLSKVQKVLALILGTRAGSEDPAGIRG